MKPTMERIMEANRALFGSYLRDGAEWKLVEGNHKGHWFVKFTVPQDHGGTDRFTYVVMDDGRMQYYFG